MQEREPLVRLAGGDDDRRLVRLPFQAPGGDVRSWPARLGEHTREVLAEAGLNEDEIERAMSAYLGSATAYY